MGDRDYDKEKVMQGAAKIFAKSNKDIIKEMTSVSADIVIKEMERTINMVGIEAFIEGKFLPYAASSVILAFSGRDISGKNISSLLKAMDIGPDKEMLGLIDSLKYTNHLIYLNALYLLLVLGRDPAEDELAKVVEAMGVKPNPEAIEFIMGIYKEKLVKAWG